MELVGVRVASPVFLHFLFLGVGNIGIFQRGSSGLSGCSLGAGSRTMHMALYLSLVVAICRVRNNNDASKGLGLAAISLSMKVLDMYIQPWILNAYFRTLRKVQTA